MFTEVYISLQDVDFSNLFYVILCYLVLFFDYKSICSYFIQVLFIP